jgi:drug/metabolite transporter (DMT)-like permease
LKRLLKHRFAPHLLLAAATLVWGGSFLVTRTAVQDVPPLLFVGLRFATASVLVACITRPRMIRLTRTELRAGSRIALVMFAGYGLQATGMHMGVTSGRAAFLSALYVPVVPLLQLLVLKRQPKPTTWVGLCLALAGLLLLAGPFGSEKAGVAELLVLAGALSFAVEILLIGNFAARVDPRRLAVVECALLALLCLAGTFVSGVAWPALRPGWVLSALGLGLASAGLQISVNWAQRYVPPAQATLLYTLEPVWAALFGALAGERMGPLGLAGAGLILASLAVSAR